MRAGLYPSPCPLVWIMGLKLSFIKKMKSKDVVEFYVENPFVKIKDE